MRRPSMRLSKADIHLDLSASLGMMIADTFQPTGQEVVGCQFVSYLPGMSSACIVCHLLALHIGECCWFQGIKMAAGGTDGHLL